MDTAALTDAYQATRDREGTADGGQPTEDATRASESESTW